MVRVRSVVGVIGAVSMIGLAAMGCSPAKQTATMEPNATTTSQQASTTDSAGFEKLQDVVAKTKTATEAGNFTEAQTEFGQFEDAWRPVEDGVKTKSPDNYDTIEANADKVTTALKGSKPDKAQVLTSLQTLNDTIANTAKL